MYEIFNNALENESRYTLNVTEGLRNELLNIPPMYFYRTYMHM